MRPLARSSARPGAWAAAVAVLTLAALAVRLVLLRQSLFGDELATAWVVSADGVRGLLRVVRSDAEITPPAYFLLAKAAGKLGSSPELLRLPSLVAGTATVPLVALVGRRLAGPLAGVLAAALVAFAPFMTYYSTEARGYAVMMACVVLSTLAMLEGVRTGRRSAWVLFGAATCGAAYTHYTCIFVLAAQLAWLLVVHPAARRPALVATGAAVICFLPWLGGLRADFDSPTGGILAALSPLGVHEVLVSVEHWSFGYPYSTVPPRSVPGAVGLLLLALAAAGVLAGLAARAAGRRPATDRRPATPTRSGWVLLTLLALATPVGTLLQSLVGSSIFSTRNLAASWPGLALAVAALVAAVPLRALRAVAATCLVAGAAVAAVTSLDPYHGRPDTDAAGRWVASHARPGDAVVDATVVLSPGPLSPLDLVSLGRLPVFRAGSPAERTRPFTVFDTAVTRQQAFDAAVAAAPRGRIFFVSVRYPQVSAIAQRIAALRAGGRLPRGYRLVAQHEWRTRLGGPLVQVFARP